MAQVIDIGAVSDGPALTLNKSEPESPKPIEVSVDKPSVNKPSVNFGGGIEFLMNDKLKTDNKQKADIDLGDINELESELNNLTEDISIQKSSSLENIKINDGPSVTSNSVKFEDLGSKDTEIPSISTPMAKATASQSKDEESNKTWDGFGKFNNIPLDPDKQVPAKPKLTHEELLREKFKALRKLEALEKKGVKLSKRYTMESSLEEMQGEYEHIRKRVLG
jgi:hypothetical protein